MDTKYKIFQMVGIDSAMHFLRPGAKWEWTGGVGFTRWDDPRPKPSVDEVMETIEKIRAFEESIDTVYLPEQLEAINAQIEQIQQAVN